MSDVGYVLDSGTMSDVGYDWLVSGTMSDVGYDWLVNE